MSPLESLIQTALGTDYRLEQEISGGGMSRLYFATDLRLNRRVVVKVLSPELISDTSIARFKREIEVTVQLQHPHILPILTSGSCEDMLFYITPFIAGESLKDRIVRSGKLPLDDVIEILRNVSGALAFAHSRGVVHRDIKPGNILLAERHAVLADFGIAKATERSSAALTATGVMPGTPAYMAPELPTDEKADVYALGVVAYEMLCGAMPKRGVTAKQIILARGAVPGDDRDRVRSIATLVANTLSMSAETRTESAQAFANDLDRRPRTYGRLALVGAAVAIVAIGAAFILNPGRRGLDGNRYAVMPLSQPADAPLAADVAQRVSDAFGEWRGPSVVDQRAVTGATAKRASHPLEPKDAALVGRSLGAGNVVALDTRREGDSVVIRATLVDVALDSLLRTRRMAYSPADGQAAQSMAIRRLVNSILRDGAELPWRSVADRDTASLTGWRAYDNGRAAIQRWDLVAATQAFRGAIAAEPKLAPAHLWLAQTLLWSRSSANVLDPRAVAPLEARNSARRALDLSRRLDPRDSARAAGVLMLADARYPEACSAFARLIALDSTDVGGWIGLGDCQAQDPSVLPSPGSRTGWRFRTSFEGAARAYQRAVDVGPAEDESPFQGWALGRLSGVLYTVPNHVRVGQAANPDSVTLAAFPFLDHDTLAFQPFLVRDLNTGKYDPPQSAVQAAVQRNRTLLRRSAEEWVRRAPKNGAAYDSLAGWMEVSGGVGMLGEKQAGTLEVLRRARALTTDSVAQLRLAIADVRLLVKDSRFAEARAEADSVLGAPIAKTHSSVVGVAGLAALLGYVGRTAQLLAVAADEPISMPDGSRLVPPQQVHQVTGELLAYTTLDVPGDSIQAIAARALTVVHSHFRDSTTAARVGTVLVGRPLTLSYPAGAQLLRQIEPPTDLTSRGYSALARGDTAAARTTLAEARALSARSTGGTVDASLRRARLALMLRDTTSALSELDPVLRALPTIRPSLLDQVPQAAALVRALALRAEIADRMLDRATARQCASAVVDLWLNADAPLQPIVARMKTLAGRS